VHSVKYIGGAERGVGGCALAVNPCAPAGKPSSYAAPVFAFHSTISLTNRGQLFWCAWYQKSGFWKQIFKKISWGNTPGPLCGRGLPCPCAGRKHPSAGTRRALLEVMVLHLCPSMNKFLALPLVS